MLEKITISQMLANSIQQYGSNSALSSKIDGSYQDITYAELGNRVKYFCLGLIELGVERGDRVVLLSENCPKLSIIVHTNTNATIVKYAKCDYQSLRVGHKAVR